MQGMVKVTLTILGFWLAVFGVAWYILGLPDALIPAAWPAAICGFVWVRYYLQFREWRRTRTVEEDQQCSVHLAANLNRPLPGR